MGIEYAGKKQGRNELCTCGSGLKFKKCHGDPAKLLVVRHIANEVMLIMIAMTKLERGKEDFGFDDYDKVVNNPDLVLPGFIAQYGLNFLGEEDAS